MIKTVTIQQKKNCKTWETIIAIGLKVIKKNSWHHFLFLEDFCDKKVQIIESCGGFRKSVFKSLINFWP